MPSMGQSSFVTVPMDVEEQPVFHDFLGIAGERGDVKQPEIITLDATKAPRKISGTVEEVEGEASTRASSINSGRFEACSASVTLSEHLLRAKETGAQHLVNTSATFKAEVDSRQGKRRDITKSRDSLQEQLQMSMEALDNSRLLKASRLERQDDRKSRHHDVGVDDLHLTMQPPRLSSKGPNPHPSSVNKADFPTVVSKKWDSSRPVSFNTGIFGPTRTGHLGLHLDKLAANNFRENPLTPGPPLPPADEGSRTGLKGSGVANLLNTGSGNPAIGLGPLPGRSKLWSQNPGSESTFVASQQTTTPTSRQLTIFYAGQAHVFDDVPPDKAEAVMTLAGSSGRSWSTIYSPRRKASLPLSASEGSLSSFDRDREKSASKASAANGFSSLALSTDIHNPLSSSVQLGQGSGHAGHSNVPETNFAVWSSDMQTTTDRSGSCAKKQEGREMPLMHVSTGLGRAGKELI